MADPVQAEKVVTKVEHFGAAAMDTATHPDIVRMQRVKAEKGAAAMFSEEVNVPDENAKQPNFDELKKVIDRLPGSVIVGSADFNPDKARVNDRLKMLRSVTSKVDFATLPAPEQTQQLQYIGTVAAEVPAIVQLVMKETGATNMNAVKNELRNASTADVRALLIRFRNDPSFVDLLKNKVGNIEVKDDALEVDAKLSSLRSKVTTEDADITATKAVYDAAKTWFETTLTPADRIQVQNATALYEAGLNALHADNLGDLKRANLSSPEVAPYLVIVNGRIAAAFGVSGLPRMRTSIPQLAYDKATTLGGTPQRIQQNELRFTNELDVLFTAKDAAASIQQAYLRGTFLADYQQYKSYLDRPQKLAELKAREDTLADNKGQLAKLEIQSGKTITDVTGKIDNVAERAFKEYHNKELLKQALKVAEYDAQQKTEEKQKAADLKEKQEQNAEELLKRYLRLSYLRFKGQRLRGWDDKGLKTLVKKDVYHNSPAEMARLFLRRVYDKRSQLPDTYQREIEALTKEMGVGVGPPPVSFDNVINGIDTAKLIDLAASEMPKAFGYARAKGYYFDRMRVNRSQAEYIRTAYSPEFFDKMGEHEKDFYTQFNKEFGKGILTGRDETSKRIRELILGRDWGQGAHRLMNVAAAAGATALVVGYLGGLPTLGVLGQAGVEIGALGGKVGTKVLQEAAIAVGSGAADLNSQIPLPKI